MNVSRSTFYKAPDVEQLCCASSPTKPCTGPSRSSRVTLQEHARPNDCLAALSTGGLSRNIVRAAEAALIAQLNSLRFQ